MMMAGEQYCLPGPFFAHEKNIFFVFDSTDLAVLPPEFAIFPFDKPSGPTILNPGHRLEEGLPGPVFNQ
jgi:hypothetical protein